MYFAPIRAALKAILDGLVTSNDLATVFNGEQNKQASQVPAFPAVELARVNSKTDMLDNRTDETDFVFEIRIFTPIHHELSQGDAEVTAETAIDAVWGALMANTHLSGLLENRIRPITSNPGTHTWNGQTVRRDTIVVSCTKLVSLT